VALKKNPDELRERAIRLYRNTEPRPVIRRRAEQCGFERLKIKLRPCLRRLGAPA